MWFLCFLNTFLLRAEAGSGRTPCIHSAMTRQENDDKVGQIIIVILFFISIIS